MQTTQNATQDAPPVSQSQPEAPISQSQPPQAPQTQTNEAGSKEKDKGKGKGKQPTKAKTAKGGKKRKLGEASGTK